MSSPLLDSPQRYGVVSRTLHWLMVAVLAWQFTGMLLKITVGRENDIAAFIMGTHKPVGALLMLLVLLRAAWGLSQLRRRPRQPGTLRGRVATTAHGVMYLLMLYIPFVALMRDYGRGRGFSPFGIPLFPETGQQVDWMMAPASASHGLMGWTLLTLIVGHILMVAVHQVLLRDGTAARMAGRARLG
ncbi:cytochrome b [Luteimonas sp. A277]